MLSFCALILIDICIPRDLIPVTTYEAMYTSQEMEARNARGRAGQEKTGLIIDLLASDSLVEVAQSNQQISRACNTKACVYYRRHRVSNHECHYAFALLTRRASDTGQNPVFAKSLVLAAPDALAFAKLARRLTFKIGANETNGEPEAQAIAIADLEHESPYTNDTKLPMPRRKLPAR
jgi:hypothetical protein